MKRSETNDAISKSLASAHSAVNARHERTRARLLESLPVVALPNRGFALSPTWTYVVGGLGAVSMAILLILWLFSSTPPAWAMERMAQALDDVVSYSFRMESVYVSRQDKGRTVRQVTVGNWRTQPVSLHATIDVKETVAEPQAYVVAAVRGKVPQPFVHDGQGFFLVVTSRSDHVQADGNVGTAVGEFEIAAIACTDAHEGRSIIDRVCRPRSRAVFGRDAEQEPEAK